MHRGRSPPGGWRGGPPPPDYYSARDLPSGGALRSRERDHIHTERGRSPPRDSGRGGYGGMERAWSGPAPLSSYGRGSSPPRDARGRLDDRQHQSSSLYLGAGDHRGGGGGRPRSRSRSPPHLAAQAQYRHLGDPGGYRGGSGARDYPSNGRPASGTLSAPPPPGGYGARGGPERDDQRGPTPAGGGGEGRGPPRYAASSMAAPPWVHESAELPRELKDVIERAYADKLLRPGDVLQSNVAGLAQMPLRLALMALDEFINMDKSRVNHPAAFFTGVMKRILTEHGDHREAAVLPRAPGAMERERARDGLPRGGDRDRLDDRLGDVRGEPGRERGRERAGDREANRERGERGWPRESGFDRGRSGGGDYLARDKDRGGAPEYMTLDPPPRRANASPPPRGNGHLPPPPRLPPPPAAAAVSSAERHWRDSALDRGAPPPPPPPSSRGSERDGLPTRAPPLGYEERERLARYERDDGSRGSGPPTASRVPPSLPVSLSDRDRDRDRDYALGRGGGSLSLMPYSSSPPPLRGRSRSPPPRRPLSPPRTGPGYAGGPVYDRGGPLAPPPQRYDASPPRRRARSPPPSLGRVGGPGGRPGYLGPPPRHPIDAPAHLDWRGSAPPPGWRSEPLPGLGGGRPGGVRATGTGRPVVRSSVAAGDDDARVVEAGNGARGEKRRREEGEVAEGQAGVGERRSSPGREVDGDKERTAAGKAGGDPPGGAAEDPREQLGGGSGSYSKRPRGAEDGESERAGLAAVEEKEDVGRAGGRGQGGSGSRDGDGGEGEGGGRSRGGSRGERTILDELLGEEEDDTINETWNAERASGGGEEDEDEGGGAFDMANLVDQKQVQQAMDTT